PRQRRLDRHCPAVLTALVPDETSYSHGPLHSHKLLHVFRTADHDRTRGRRGSRRSALPSIGAAAAAAVLFASSAPVATAAPAHPYEAIAGHYATMREANAVAAKAH